jgi:F420-non-reducing hydrogenase large subunit
VTGPAASQGLGHSKELLKDPATLDLVLSDTYCHRTYSIGLVDGAGKVDFYDGTMRVVDPDGSERCRYRPEQYLERIGEAVLPYSYLKCPYLKKVGWKGLVDGAESGVYRATPLSRLNVSEGMATPLAQASTSGSTRG